MELLYEIIASLSYPRVPTPDQNLRKEILDSKQLTEGGSGLAQHCQAPPPPTWVPSSEGPTPSLPRPTHTFSAVGSQGLTSPKSLSWLGKSSPR